jgi:hypothetical protein
MLFGFHRTVVAGLFGIVVGLSGCDSGGPPLGKVTGKVTLDGKPAPGIVLTFVPESGGSPSYGVSDGEGKYVLKFTDDKDGAMIGKHKVTLESQPGLSKEEMAEMKASGESVPDFTPASLPKKYRGDGTISVEVNRGNNDIPIELTSN